MNATVGIDPVDASAGYERWAAAQSSELSYWRGLGGQEALRLCAEKAAFFALLGDAAASEFLGDKTVLEIGCGPVGISIVSFAPCKHRVRQLVKTDPLPRLALRDTKLRSEAWAAPLLAWLDALAEEGDYLQVAGEDMPFEARFDTVVVYNVLDHVRDPLGILRHAARALRPGGHVLVAVDCRSVLGRLRFDWWTRRTQAGTILVDAHPHTFVPDMVERLIERAGFRIRHRYGIPGTLGRWIGRAIRPVFVAQKR